MLSPHSEKWGGGGARPLRPPAIDARAREDSLKQHIQRANYQAGVRRGALLPMPDIPEPDGHGWIKRADRALTWIGYTDRLLLLLYWSFLHASASGNVCQMIVHVW